MKSSHLVGIGAFWLASIAYGFWDVRKFESTPGNALPAPPSWPAASSIPRRSGATTLVMFVHPKCSCTRASLEELSALLADMPRPVAAWIIIEADSATRHTDDMPGASIVQRLDAKQTFDPQGTEGRLFGALTSGHTVVYDAAGRLRFSGGITGARGHVGDNWGLARLITTVKQPASGAMAHSVYGCPL